ncbi:MAG: hypothetical protein SF028_04405 [Candidatus Sumerlaeia bacterium]|nr:hypothetical protein [Candidatus Sumerlaeia bacterium]
MASLARFAPLAAAMLFLCGCSMSRTTTTTRTAVEQALLTRSAEESLGTQSLAGFEGRSFHIEDIGFDHPQAAQLAREFEERLLAAGGRRAADAASADLVVVPLVDYAAIDDDEVLIGLPALTLPIPGATAVAFPELALYKRSNQQGRASLGLLARDARTGELAVHAAPQWGVKFYTRYKFLFFFTFRTTNLGGPF